MSSKKRGQHHHKKGTAKLKKPLVIKENLPSHKLGELGNYKGITGEEYLRDYQYPQTIFNVCQKLEREKFERFVDGLTGNEEDVHPSEILKNCDSGEPQKSEAGCLRWVYDHKFFNDGQERYEAADDVSFDVRGNFCYRCEMARRLVELRPIAYETPTEFGKATFEEEGFTRRLWEWNSEEEKLVRNNDRDFIELSTDAFKSMLIMLKAFGLYEEELRGCAGSYRCGGRRVYVLEKMTPYASSASESLDYQEDIARTIRNLETPRKLLNGKVEVSILVSEINPFVTSKGSGNNNKEEDGNDDQCFYNPRLTLNINSNVVHTLSIRMDFPETGQQICFVCPGKDNLIDYRLISSLDSFPEIEPYYPAVFYGRRNVGEVLLYGLMFLMNPDESEFANVVNNKPTDFYKLCSNAFDRVNAESFRRRLILHKRNYRTFAFPKAINSLRDSIIGLKLIS
jgi:hypothetical protein